MTTTTHISQRAPWLLVGLLLALCSAFVPRTVHASHLRDLVNIAGARENQLVGYGILTGLNGTGDDLSVPYTQQTVLSLLRRLGIQVDNRMLRLRNVAAVVVTATVPAFARSGTHLDVTVSSLGNARSLVGGVLVQTILRGPDQQAYAVAQGSVLIGGMDARGVTGTQARVNSTNAGRIAQGALMEREIPTTWVQDDALRLDLKVPGFAVASRVAQAINTRFGDATAAALDAGAVSVHVPDSFRTDHVGLIAALEDLDVDVVRAARVVINERTGTIVAGGDVRLSPVAVVHANLTVIVRETPTASQPVAPFGTTGNTAIVPNSDVQLHEPTRPLSYLPAAPTLSDVAATLSTLGLSPRELASVLQALHQAGALEAELVIQ